MFNVVQDDRSLQFDNESDNDINDKSYVSDNSSYIIKGVESPVDRRREHRLTSIIDNLTRTKCMKGEKIFYNATVNYVNFVFLMRNTSTFSLWHIQII